jgi:Coenzyme PQQ synthesis protein D (PqqD)
MGDELLVYDERADVVSALNRTAAIVWRSCDGLHTIAELVDVLGEEIGDLADEDLVMLTLDSLDEQGLFESGYRRREPDEASFSRRRFIRQAGVVGTASALLPVVASVVAPTPAAAATIGPSGPTGPTGLSG